MFSYAVHFDILLFRVRNMKTGKDIKKIKELREFAHYNNEIRVVKHKTY